MKKMIVFLLILALALTAAMTGCGGSESASDADRPDSVQDGEAGDAAKAEEDVDTEGLGDLLSAAYVDMMKSNEYLMSYKTTMDVEGEAAEVEATIAVKGDDMAMTSSGQGLESTVIIKDDRVYMVDHPSKTVTSWAQSQSDMDAMETGGIDTEGITYIGSGKEDGLVYEEYSTSDSQIKYYFDGKKLVKIAVTMEGQTVEMEILEMSSDVPSGMFEIPDGYQKIEM